MTKPITAIAALKLIEDGKIGLYDTISKYIPEYKYMRVCARRIGDEVYVPDPDSPTGVRASEEIVEGMTYVDAEREITVYDLLTHSSGLGMGPVGITLAGGVSDTRDTIGERARKYAGIPLDFQPGAESGYSAVLGMEVLAALIEIASGQSFDEYLDKNIKEPMEIRDITFSPDDEQRTRIPRLYKYTEDQCLEDVTETESCWLDVDPVNYMHSGAAGLYGSMEEYDKIARMLLRV